MKLDLLVSLGAVAIVLGGRPDAARAAQGPAPDVVRERFAARMAAGSRHSVHVDAEILADEWPDPIEFELDLGVPSLVIDTTSGYRPDLDSIVRFVG